MIELANELASKYFFVFAVIHLIAFVALIWAGIADCITSIRISEDTEQWFAARKVLLAQHLSKGSPEIMALLIEYDSLVNHKEKTVNIPDGT